jgi:putrescine transport system permease protein
MNNFLIRYFGKAWMALVYLFLYLPLFFMMVFSFNSTRQDAQLHRFFVALVRGADQRHQAGGRLLAVVASGHGRLVLLSAVLAYFCCLCAGALPAVHRGAHCFQAW